MIEKRYAINVRRPITLLTTKTLATLHAGPAINNTSAAPGVSPFIINATAIGMLPVAHRYMGMEMHNTSSIDVKLLSLKISKYESGTKIVISPATTSPTTSYFPTLSTMSI